MQTIDFVALATRVTGGVEGIRACLIQSREGLTLGVYPPEAEGRTREAWRRLQALGDAQRGFVDLSEEVVVVARHGPYVAVALAAPDVRPGLVLDLLDAGLGAAQGERAQAARAEPLSTTPSPAPVRRRRTPRHTNAANREQQRKPGLPADPFDPAPVEGSETSSQPANPDTGGDAPQVVEVPEPASRGIGARLRRLAGAQPAVEAAVPAFEEAVAGPAAEPRSVEAPLPANDARADLPRVDRAALAREFGRLLADEARGEG